MAGVVVVDYGMGNLRSIGTALRSMADDVLVSADAAELGRADRVVLPGVGAFGRSMVELRERHLVEPVRAFIASGRPFLGICLGYQVLFDRTTEHGHHEGLGLFGGAVERFEGSGLIVPHMGWNQLRLATEHPLYDGIADGAHVYFVHSYRPSSVERADVLAHTDYGGAFAASVVRDNLAGVQFHPEKSGRVGLRILQNFLAWRAT